MTLEELKAKAAPKTKKVAIDGLGDVYIAEIPDPDFVEAQDAVNGLTGEGCKINVFKAMIVGAGIVDENGQRLFSDRHAAETFAMGCSRRVFNAIFDAVAEFNYINVASAENAEKN